MEHEPWVVIPRGARGVEGVAEDGSAQASRVGHVDAELVGSAGNGFEPEPGAVGLSGEDAEVCDSRLSGIEADDLVWPVGPIDAEWEVDLARIGLDGSFDEGDVVFFDAASLELDGEVPLGAAVQTEHDQTRGVHIEAVDDHGPRGCGEEVQHAGGDAIGFVGAPAGDAEQAGGLVDHDEPLILVDDVDVGMVLGRGVHAPATLWPAHRIGLR